MPTANAKRRARRDARAGKKPSTQAGEFVREEMREYKRGKGTARSRKQAVAIGLSEARRAGVKLGTPKKGKAAPATRRKAKQDSAAGSRKTKPKATRSPAKSSRASSPRKSTRKPATRRATRR
ncbi:MAG TPA: DUF6496 domain-containing protein [Opitutus sp.]|nr:DUF6496 domain-containing protein [Opitutus sp.]